MSNVFAPFGFADTRRLGASPNYQLATGRILSTSTTAIYIGDPVVQLSTGYITQASAGSTQIHGIFMGCKYMSTSQKKMVWGPWLGTDATSDPEARVINDPQMVFRVQGNAQITLAMVGANAQFSLGAGAARGGAGSTACLDISGTTPTTTTTLPFRIIGLVTDPPGANGTDTTSSYNICEVTFNYQDYKSLTGI